MLLTSHYGPRQGIYQPMESFKSANWRTAPIGVVTVVEGDKCCYRADTHILIPPNSFPARSLTRKQNYRPISVSTLQSSLHTVKNKDSSAPMPSNPPSSSSLKSSLSSLQGIPPAASSEPVQNKSYIQILHKPSPPRQAVSDQQQQQQQQQHQPRPTALTSKAAQMHQRTPTIKSTSQSSIYGSAAFPYPNPTRVQGTFAARLAFTSRLSELMRLQTETVKQECLSVYRGPRPSSSCNNVPLSCATQSQQSRAYQQTNVFERLSMPIKRQTTAAEARPQSAEPSTNTSKVEKGQRARKSSGRKKVAVGTSRSSIQISCDGHKAATESRQSKPTEKAAHNRTKRKGKHVTKSSSSCSLSTRRQINHSPKHKVRPKSAKGK